MSTLIKLRAKIEKVDAAIIKKLAERQVIVKKIGVLKEKNGRKIVSTTREKKLSHFHADLSKRYDLKPKLVKDLFKLIIHYSRQIQRK